jgi:hypothetical protein
VWRSLDELALPAPLRRYAELVEGSGQLVPFLATCAGLKPAMDDWVPVANRDEYTELLDRLGLCWSIDASFEFMAGGVPPEPIVGAERLNTTRAFGYPPDRQRPGQRLHIFLARGRDELTRAEVDGWYPLVIGDRVVEKPWIDHYRFGAALGFPECCRRFFARHNDWWADNSLFQAWRRTDEPTFLANSLLKYTGFSYAAYLPCAFDCPATVAYARRVRDLVHASCPSLGDYVDSLLRRVYLVLSEWEIYAFAGGRVDGDSLAYRDVALVPTDRPDAELFRLLGAGNRVELRDDVLVVFRDAEVAGAYPVDGARFGPQASFLVDFGTGSG